MLGVQVQKLEESAERQTGLERRCEANSCHPDLARSRYHLPYALLGKYLKKINFEPAAVFLSLLPSTCTLCIASRNLRLGIAPREPAKRVTSPRSARQTFYGAHRSISSNRRAILLARNVVSSMCSLVS